MMYLSHKKKVLLSAAVLFALASGEAFASSYHGGTSDVTSSNETLDELYATNKAKVTVTGSGTITFTPSGTADGEGAIDASGGSVVTIGSSSLPYDVDGKWGNPCRGQEYGESLCKRNHHQ